MTKIGIINYGSGNLSAFVNVFNSLNKNVIIISNPKDLDSCSHVIMPGVSAWDTTMKSVQNFHQDLLKNVINKNKPFLGVCVGMQILASYSDEGSFEGLNWISGKVKKLPNVQVLEKDDFLGPVLPHMGWNNVSIMKDSQITKDLPENSEFYFLHSYFFDIVEEEDVIAKTEFNSYAFPVIVQKENIFGVQFHPEKSHEFGKTLLSNFANL
jgi:glutamine amidotransferase